MKVDRLKILVMGATDAGKTAIIKQLLYGLVSKELKDLEPTILVKVHSNYSYGNYVCQFFECGGQERMFDEYYRPERESVLFSKVNIFLYVVDSADAQRLGLAKKEFWRSIRKITKYSPQALPVVFAHKQDLRVHLPPEEVKDILFNPQKLKHIDCIPKEPRERRRVEKLLKRVLLYSTSIEDPPEDLDRKLAWVRSDKAILMIIDAYKNYLREMTLSGIGAKREYPEELLHSLVELLKDLDGIVGSVGSVIVDKSNNFIVATTLTEEYLSSTTAGNIIRHSAKILEDRGENLREAILLPGDVATIVMQNINEELALVSVLPLDVKYEEEDLLRIVEGFVNKIREGLNP